MTRSGQFPPARSRQKGAALAIGLILLLVLTLLAVSGMNTASTELVMAGNEQYRQNAAQASQTGIEQTLSVLRKVSQTCTPDQIPAADTPNEDDGFEHTVTAQYEGETPSPPGYSSDYVALHYEIVSTGKSKRNATSVQTQGAYIVQNKGDSTSLGCLDQSGSPGSAAGESAP